MLSTFLFDQEGPCS